MTLPISLSVDALTVFPLDYGAARSRFLTLTEACVQLTDHYSFTLDALSSKSRQLLSTEIAWIGARDAKNVLVLVSATHGVEGFVGAAAQSDLLQRLHQGYALAEDSAILLVFALNPWGFAEQRRCDEQGIDLNRNFVDFTQTLPVNDGYLRLQQAIYEADPALRQAQFEHFRDEHGQIAFEIAISGGQYSDPQGPFYGGQGPAHGHRVIEQVIERYQLAQRQLAVVDIHSGLGAYGHGEVINDHASNTRAYQIVNRWYGASVTAPAMGTSSSVNKLGLMDYHWHPLMTERGCFVTLEFGSYPTEALFEVILQDHRCWAAGDARAIQEVAVAMREHFCPEDSYWREMVLIKSRQVIQQALDGLHHG